MIVTLTPNPSIDRTVTLDHLTVGGVNRVSTVRQDPGGKGVNVSRALNYHGAATLAVMPLGGPEGSMLAKLLGDESVPLQQVSIPGSTRINLTIAGDDGITTKVNEPGPRLHPDTVAALMGATVGAAPGGWVLGAGSLPTGLEPHFYADLVDSAHGAGAQVAIDSSGEAMRLAIAAGPDLVKPNHHELGELLGRDIVTLGDVVTAATELHHNGIANVVVSLGGSGALAVSDEGVVYARAEKTKPVSTVGAGDALLAGFLYGKTQNLPLASCLELGVKFGTAAVQLPGSKMPTPEDIQHVTVTFCEHIDLDEAVEE